MMQLQIVTIGVVQTLQIIIKQFLLTQVSNYSNNKSIFILLCCHTSYRQYIQCDNICDYHYFCAFFNQEDTDFQKITFCRIYS